MDEILITRLRLLITQIDTLSDQAQNLISVNDDSLYDAEMIIAKLTGLLTRFQDDLNNYFRLVNVPSADDIGEMTVVQLKAEENLTELKVKLRLFTKHKENGETCKTTNFAATSVSCRLPKLNLPEFDGDILSWHQFWDQFQSNIHNRNLPDVDKLLYLKSCIKGDAQKTIEGLETTNKNYTIAIETLKERYGRSSHLIDAHYSALSKVTASESTIASCRKTYNQIEKHLRVLESLGEDVNHNHLRHLIFARFPEDLIYELKLKTNDDSIHEIRKQLENIITAREDANRITQGNNSKEAQNYTVETLHVAQGNNKYGRGEPFVRRGFGHNVRNNQPFRREPQNSRKRRHDQRGEQKEDIRFRKNIRHNYTSDFKRRRISCAFCYGNHYADRCDKYKDVKQRKAHLEGRCFGCLKPGHDVKNCAFKDVCVYCKKAGHNRALCTIKFPYQVKTKTTSLITETETSSLSGVNTRGHTVLQTAVATARRDRVDSASVRCRILFDSGSQRTYVTRKVAQELNLPTEEEESLSVYTFGSRSPQEFQSPVVKLELETKSKDSQTVYANVVPMISQGVPYVKELTGWTDKDKLADDGSLANQVDILIGNDYYNSFLRLEKIQLGENLYLIDSEFGWILSGKIPAVRKDDEHMSVITYFQAGIDFKLNKPDAPLDHGSVAFLWELESIGITDSPKITRDEEAISKFNETTTLIDNRYHVSWPWNEYPPALTSNYGLAYGRLVNLIKRLDRETLKSYDDTIQEQISKGIVEEAPVTRNVDHPVHYLPHHCVTPKGKPIRIVYDASAKIKGNKSLNDCLYCGPLMLEDLTRLLIRFRSHNIALSADVEKAFLQIGLCERDRDVTRFLWLKDIEKPPNRENLVCMRFCRVPFGIISSPFLLNATIKHHLSKGNEHIQRLTKDIYVDNLVTGVQTQEDALRLYTEVKGVFQEISMNLRDWSSNSKYFMNKVPDTTEENVVKILGLDWHLEHDSLHMRFKINSDAKSKREVLKVIASVYDPCGFVVPYVLSAKLFLQELWQSKIKWDTTFSKEMQDKWLEIRKSLEDIKEISVPRCFMENVNSNNYHLHCFTDASLKAYAAVVYITHGTKRSFVIGKSRLVPIKDQQNLQIPRLELLGVLIGCRLVKLVLKAFNMEISHQTLWTDSQIVIEWCQSNKLLPPFVARRIEEIKRNKELMIKYVPSELNPADVATKLSSSVDHKKKWLKGPEFLSEPIKYTFPATCTSQNFLSSAREGLPNTSEDLESNIHMAKPATANVEAKKESDVNKLGPPSVIKEIKKLQAEYFPKEVAGRETDLSRNLKLFKDVDGVLRCKGRLQNAELSFDNRYPILIPKECDFTLNLIKRIHSDNYHVGVNHTLSLIRQSYWIPQGKTQVQRVLRKCLRCVKHGGGPYKLPPTPALPPERVNYSAPFTFTGIDYLGPVMVKSGQGAIKRWICLFTCLAVRAVHLEVVQDLTAEEALLALRRMIANRGVPTLVTSDNASNFRLLSEVISQPYCVDNKIQWKFIPQLAPWFGGYYERLIGIVKVCMKRTLEKHMLSDTQLTTVVKEIEAVVNTRPLTCVDSELDIILKPADFLSPGRCIAIEEASKDRIEKGTSIKVDLIKAWKRGIVILQEFKEMFINRYLPSLRERYHHSLKEPRVTSKLSPTIGQVVQIKADNKNRETWKVGKIISLQRGSDGLCRVAVVRVGDKEFTRSIAHLYPLEVPEKEEEIGFGSRENNVSNENSPTTFTETSNKEREHFDEVTEQQTLDLDDAGYNTSRQPLHAIEFGGDLGPEDRNQERSEQNNANRERLEPLESDIDERLEPLERTIDIDNERANTRVTRVAAIKARQKIREWTNQLFCLHVFAGPECRES